MKHVRRLSMLVAMAVATIALVVGPLRVGSAQESESGVMGTPAANECVTDVGTTEVPDGALAYSILGEASIARYRAQEELASIGANEAIGETNAIIGMIMLDAEGNPLPCSRFDVDLRTLTSDEARRDNFLYDNTLETGQYPLATFVLTSVESLDAPLLDGEETPLVLVGNLTMHGETHLIGWEARVTRDGDRLTGVASTAFDMADFAIEEPVIGPVVSVDETIQLEVEIAAEIAA